MLPPVRCFTCGKPLGGKIYSSFRKGLEEGKDPEELFEKLGVERYCCRSILMTSENYFDEIMIYSKKQRST